MSPGHIMQVKNGLLRGSTITGLLSCIRDENYQEERFLEENLSLS